MDRVVGFQKESAAANGWEFVDFSAPMVEIGRRAYRYVGWLLRNDASARARDKGGRTFVLTPA